MTGAPPSASPGLRDEDILPPSLAPLLRVFGPVVLRPWYDRIILRGIARWYLPLSRIWAEAVDEPDSARLAEILEVPRRQTKRLENAHARLLPRVEQHRACEARWREVFFGGADFEEARLLNLEKERAWAATKYMGARFYFKGLQRRIKVRSAAFEVLGPEAFPAAQRARLDAPGGAFPVPEAIEPERSRPLSEPPLGRLSWLRFPSPSAGDTVWARVIEPEDAGPETPTLIYLHGIAMESEYLPEQTIDATNLLLARGVRLVKPVGPWHAMRRERHRYGGEPVIAKGPLGMIELFQHWVGELGVLTAWAKRTYGGPVAVGGVSLGALTSQKMASESRDWPAEYRPDALFLVTTTGDLVNLAFEGSLVRASGLTPYLIQSGWTEEAFEPLHRLYAPEKEPPMPPERRIMVLGSADDLTPFPGGMELARRWQLPPENLFVRHQGHFTASMGLARYRSPLDRLAEVLRLAG